MTGIVEVLAASLAGTLVVTVAFSVAIRSMVAVTARRGEQRDGAAAAQAALATLALAVFFAAVVGGVVLLAHKS